MSTKLIYQPSKRAGEYSKLAVNLYFGCTHKCLYCYNKKDRYGRYTEYDFHNNPKPKERPYSLLKKLHEECKKTSRINGPIMQSFTCDPYQPLDEEHELTRSAIVIIKENGLNVRLLTKAGELPQRDFDLLDENDFVGATLTLSNDEDSKKWEPEAALPHERIEMLRAAKEAGISTWVSMEPVIDTGQTLELIRRTHSFVDFYWVGKMNDAKHEKEININWAQFAKGAVSALERYGCNYRLKEGLRKIYENAEANG